MVQASRFRFVAFVMMAALVSACDSSSNPNPNPSASPSSSASPSPSPTTSSSPQVSCPSGNGDLVVTNNSGENVSLTLTSGSTALPVVNVSSGANVTLLEPIGVLQITVTGKVTGNTILQQSPTILCGASSALTI